MWLPPFGISLTDIILFGAAACALIVGLVAALIWRSLLSAGTTSDLAGFPVDRVSRQLGRYLGSQYRISAIAITLGALILGFLTPSRWIAATAFVIGTLVVVPVARLAIASARAAGARVTEAARHGGTSQAVQVVSQASLVSGFGATTIGLVLILASYLVLFAWLHLDDWPAAVTALALGVAVVTLITRIGGGIYTKAADIGADSVGKYEAGLSEDDPSNPASVADAVGDLVGGLVGASTDIFGSYVLALTGAVIYAQLAFTHLPGQINLLLLPVAVAAVGAAGSVVGMALIRPRGDNPASGMAWALVATLGFSALAVTGLVLGMFADGGLLHPFGLALAVDAGLICGWALTRVSEWFTSDHYKTVKEVARQSQTGAATLIIGGLAEGMRSAVVSTVILLGGLGGAFAAGTWAIGRGGGGFGLALAAIGAMAPLGIASAVAAFGPTVDHAGGITRLGGAAPETAPAMTGLSAVGAATAAGSRGYATGVATVSAVAVLVAVVEAARLDAIDLTRIPALIGLVLGAAFPLLFTSLNLNAVGRSAAMIIEEARRQLRDRSRPDEGQARPDYDACADLAAARAVREMVVPAALAVVIPIAIGLIDGEGLGGFLVAAVTTGFLHAIFVVNTGGVWTGANRLIEAGAFGGVGSDQHRAAVTGDTVGDPLKDTAGPALAVAIKTMTVVALVMALSGVL